jgi:hypothetical protein
MVKEWTKMRASRINLKANFEMALTACPNWSSQQS